MTKKELDLSVVSDIQKHFIFWNFNKKRIESNFPPQFSVVKDMCEKFDSLFAYYSHYWGANPVWNFEFYKIFGAEYNSDDDCDYFSGEKSSLVIDWKKKQLWFSVLEGNKVKTLAIDIKNDAGGLFYRVNEMLEGSQYQWYIEDNSELNYIVSEYHCNQELRSYSLK